MADNFATWYMGNMAPPLRLPDGTYVPAPAVQPSMSVSDMYQGIYGSGPTTRQVKTIPIGPSGMDPMQQYAESGYVAKPRFVAAMARQQDPLQQYAESGYVAKPRFASIPAMGNSLPVLPNQPSGSIRVAKDQSRLPSGPSGWDPTYGYSPIPQTPPALAAIEQAAPTGPMFPLQMPGKGTPFKGNYTAAMRFASPNAGAVSDVIDLTAVNPRNPQAMADSQGKPIRVGGAVYYPGGRAPVGTPQARNAPATQQRSGGLGGLFGSIFGGGNLGGGKNAINVTVPGGNRTQVVAQPTSGPAIYTPQGNIHPGSLYDNAGNDASHMPRAYQDNPRNFNGGY